MLLLDQGLTTIRLEIVSNRFELIIEREEKKIKIPLSAVVLEEIIEKMTSVKEVSTL